MKKKNETPKKMMIGWHQTISLPDLGTHRFKAKIVTGARTTALHATNFSRMEVDGRQFVRFLPDHGLFDDVEERCLPIPHRRKITNTGGIAEERFIVATALQVGSRRARVEISLTDRSDMRYPIIVGRSALRVLRLSVDPSRSWLQTTRAGPQKNRIRP